MNDQSISSKILKADIKISNTLEYPPVSEKMAVYGYNREKMMQGEALLRDVQVKHQDQIREYGEKEKAVSDLDISRTTAEAVYMVHIKLARIAFKNDFDHQKALILNGKRKSSSTGWLSQSKVFYDQALASPKIMARLAEFGIDEAKLKEGQSLVKAVDDNYKRKLKEMGEAQQATKLRDEALDLLEDWISDFTAVAHIALADTPQYLEILGIIEPS